MRFGRFKQILRSTWLEMTAKKFSSTNDRMFFKAKILLEKATTKKA